jgi:hypothetical protein
MSSMAPTAEMKRAQTRSPEDWQHPIYCRLTEITLPNLRPFSEYYMGMSHSDGQQDFPIQGLFAIQRSHPAIEGGRSMHPRLHRARDIDETGQSEEA